MTKKASQYTHPDIYTTEDQVGGHVLDLKKGDFVRPGPHGVGSEQKIYDDFELYFEDLRKMEEIRVSMGIPQMSYVATTFPRYGYDVDGVLGLVEWSRKRYETRWWVNFYSGLMLICIADPDLSEDAGWDFYMWGKDIKTRDSLHGPAWWEFCMHGTRIPLDWKMEVNHTGGLIKGTSPDKRYGMILGGSA